MKRLWNLLLFTALTGIVIPGTASADEGAADEDQVSFRRDVAPILVDHCLACHGPTSADGGYRVDSFERLMRAGDSTLAAVTAGDADDSELLWRLESDNEFERMPLDADPLPPEQIQIVRRWIEQGAEYDGPSEDAPLVSILPPPEHPQAPQTYPAPLPVTAVAFSPDGSELIVGGYHELTVWDPETGELRRRIGNIGQRTYAIDFSPDGKLIAVGSGAPGKLGEARVIDYRSGEIRQAFAPTSDVVLDVAFHPDGKQLAIAAADNVIRIFDVLSGDERQTITSHSNWVMAVAWNDDGSRLASGSRDKTAKAFQMDSGELLITYSGHDEPVLGVAFHPGSDQVYSAGSDQKIHRWKIEDGSKEAEIGFGGDVYKLPRRGDYLLASSADTSVRQFQAETQELVREYSGHEDWALSVDLHLESGRVASGGFNGYVRVWDADSGELITAFLASPQ